MRETEQQTKRGTLVGRQWLLQELGNWYHSGGQRACLWASPGAGKSHLLEVFADSIPGAVIVDFSAGVYNLDWPAELSPQALGGRAPTLLILDSLEHAPPVVWRSRRLERDFPGIPILFAHRPGVHHESVVLPGTVNFELNTADPRHQQDLAMYLERNNLSGLIGLFSTFREAKFIVDNPAQGFDQIADYNTALWRETTRPHMGASRILMEQLALLIADTPEALTLETLSDFTGIPTVQILEALDHLSPILTKFNGGVRLFSGAFAANLRSAFARDLGAVHGRVVSFFRDTYPSWQEMHDPYGWRYLVYHCDRLARSSRRKDFAVLHWLNEGSFSQLKLERTGMLPSVLKDLELSLVASLESEDIPRIVSFGCRIAKLRKQESVRTVHRLADAGHLDMAEENAVLITGESQRFLVWLLFATQTLEQKNFEETERLLGVAQGFATVALDDLEVELAASLLGGMLTERALPESCQALLESLLEMNGHPRQACLAHKTVAKNHYLSKPRRKSFLQKSLASARQMSPSRLRDRLERELESRMARSSKKEQNAKAFPLFLSQAKDGQKEFKKRLKQVQKSELPPATLAAALIPVSGEKWAEDGFRSILEHLGTVSEEERKHGLAGLLQSLEDSHSKDLSTSILDGLSDQIYSLSETSERSRYFSRLALLLSAKGRPREAQQRISLAAANAFSIASSDGRSATLLGLAETVAATGPIQRARDLSFHALELRSRLQDLDLESQQLVQLLSSASGQDNQSADEIVRLGSNLRFEDTPAELEAKGRAMVVLAAGLARLGAEDHAKLYRAKAAEAVRSLEDLQLRVHLLADLASAFHASGEEKEARRLIKEARGLFNEEEEAQALMASAALLKAYVVVENKTQTKAMFVRCREFLEKTSPSQWLGQQAFLDFLRLAQGLGRVQEVLPSLDKLRKKKKLSDEERLGVLRSEILLENFEKAEAHAELLSDIVLSCHARIDLALALLALDHKKSLEHLRQIPLEDYRCEGIRRLALLNGAEIRPTMQVRVREVLCELTLLSAEHPEAMDSVLSRWIQGCPNRETIMAVADKMDWSTGAGPAFRQAMEARAPSPEDEPEPTPEPIEASPEEPEEQETEVDEDDGFQVVSLTK